MLSFQSMVNKNNYFKNTEQEIHLGEIIISMERIFCESRINNVLLKDHFINIYSATANTMTLSNPSQITDEMQYENQIFVYGEEVSDFNYLKKDTIIPVAVGAIQELDRQLIQLKQEKDALQASHDSLKDEMAELKALLQEKSVI